MTLLTVAAFDFDGTLTYRDTLLPFLLYCEGRCKAASKLLTISPFLAFDVFCGIDRQKMKERVLTRFFKGTSLVDLRKKGESFATEALPPHVRPEGLKRLKWHQDQGHRCVLISASVDVYLEPWAQALGFSDIITSKMEEDPQGKATGRLIGKNCRGQEKVRRLEAAIGPKKDNYILYAYGDSPGDKEHLQLADYPYMKEMPNV